MPAAKSTILCISRRRLLVLATAAASVAIAICALIARLGDWIGTQQSWRVAPGLLTALEWAYLGSVAAIAIGLPAIAWLAPRGRHRPALRKAGLLLASTAIGLILSESIAAAWLARSSSRTAVPVGGLRAGMQVDPRELWPPLSLDEVPLPSTFPPRDDDRAIELVVVGESSAEGVPYNAWVSIGRLVAWKLEEAVPGRQVRLQTVAKSGDTLELQHQRLARIDQKPDLMIVYCGHNEFGSRLNGAREAVPYDDDLRPTTWRRMLDAVEALSPTCELIRRASERCRLEVPPSGHRELIDVPAFTARERELLLADYRRRLEAIVSFADRIGATVVVIVPPGNDADFEPNRSFLPASTPRADREAFAGEFLAARRLEATDPRNAMAAYRRLIAHQPGFAESHYRLGVLLDRAGDREASYREFIAARDCDGYPIRCPTDFQEACRDIARRHAAILVDGQAELHAIGMRGRLDDHLFQDAMHPSLRGQLAMAQAVLRGLRSRGAFGWPESVAVTTIDPSACAARFGLGDDTWRKLCLWGVHFGNYAHGLRYDPAPRLQRKLACGSAHDRLVAGASVESLGLPNIGLPEPVPTP